MLQSILRGEFQVLVELQFGIENRHDGTVLALLRGVVTLLEDVEVGGFVLAPLHVHIIIIIAVGIVWLEVGVRHARVIDRVGETACVGHVTVLLALVGKEGGTEFEHLVQTEVGLQGDVETVVLHTPHIALLVVVACGDVVVGIVASARDRGVVLLVEHVAEEDVVPVGVEGAQTVDALLCLCREGIPTTSLVGVELTQFIENVRHPTLVLTVVVVGAQKPEFEIHFLVGIEQIETVDAETGTVGVFGGEVHHRTPYLAFLGGDDDDAVGGTRSVDGGCGSVFQHGDIVDVGGVEPCNAGLVDVIDVVEIVDYKVPLISKDQTSAGATITAEEIAKMPNRSAEAVAATVGGVFSADGEVGNMRGARSEGTVYYIDGVRVIGSHSVPQSAIDQVEVMLSGTPAMYGDVTGGIINMTTKGPSRTFGAGMEVEQSLDGYGHTRVGINAQGPLIKGKKAETALLGFFVSGEFTRNKDGAISAIGHYKATDSWLDYIKNNPLRLSSTGDGVYPNGEYTRWNM